MGNLYGMTIQQALTILRRAAGRAPGARPGWAGACGREWGSGWPEKDKRRAVVLGGERLLAQQRSDRHEVQFATSYCTSCISDIEMGLESQSYSTVQYWK